MALRYDGKGYHPRIRPYLAHSFAKFKQKATHHPLPLALRLAMERLGLGFAKFVRANTIAEREPMFMEAACGSPCLCYVDIDGYGMLQANEAEPPPADGCINASEVSVGETSKKPIFGFLAPLRRIAAVVMVFVSLLAGASACHKEPTVEPTKNITMDMTWYEIFHGQLADKGIADTLKDQSVKTLEMRLVYPQDEGVLGETSSGFPAKAFHRARDTLQNYSNLSDKLTYSGTIFVNSQGGAHLNNPTGNGTGMALEDSIWFASKGFVIKCRGVEK